MNVIIVNDNGSKKRIHFNRFLDWLMHMIAYTLVLITVSIIFSKTVYIDSSYFGFWGFMAAIITYLLNKTVKPVIVWLTLPITGLTLGLFYPFINVLIMYIVEWILSPHFMISGLFMSFIVAIFISIMNILMDTLIIEPLLRRSK